MLKETSEMERTTHPEKFCRNFTEASIVAMLAPVTVDLFFAFVSIALIGGASGKIWYYTFFLTLASFTAGLVSMYFVRRVGFCILCSVPVHILMFLLFGKASFFVLLWMFLYIFSSFLGCSVVYIILTHRRKDDKK